MPLSAEFLVWTSVWLPLLFLIMVSAATPDNTPFASFWARLSNALFVGTTFLRAVGVSEGCTNLLKHYVARRRPNFYALCQFDTVLRTCNTASSTARIKEAQYSFPSGHSSLASCGMVFVTWYLSCLLVRRPSPRRGVVAMYRHFGALLLWQCLPLILPGWAVYVGATRLADHWHHFSDVLAGLVLGSTVATLVYHTVLGPQFAYDAATATLAAETL
jgi:membrane-associated phospholipid phosphatase